MTLLSDTHRALLLFIVDEFLYEWNVLVLKVGAFSLQMQVISLSVSSGFQQSG